MITALKVEIVMGIAIEIEIEIEIEIGIEIETEKDDVIVVTIEIGTANGILEEIVDVVQAVNEEEGVVVETVIQDEDGRDQVQNHQNDLNLMTDQNHQENLTQDPTQILVRPQDQTIRNSDSHHHQKN